MRADRLQPIYEKLNEFRQLLRRFDPQGKFRNAFLERTVFGEAGPS
jgi:alditol oxidase